ncbi:transcriptional protein SWT1 [Drosophila nasuta]|uniref:transcriptional protein SWT1 n=1 Tax=Drosophila nasuta TaxID=42062 RepID=UPI00295F3584|nr:transcriptional protein SWT1 [Drosophila nasuta]
MERKLQANANDVKRTSDKASDDDKIQNLIVNNMRQHQSRRFQAPAQERLERLQLKLKSGRITKEKHVPKRPTRSATSSGSSNHMERNIGKSSSSLRNLLLSESLLCAVAASPSPSSSSNSRRSLPTNPFAKSTESNRITESSGGIRSAWAKPKALIDASNRLHHNRPLISANCRLALLQSSLQETQRNDNDNNNNNVLPNNAMTDDDEPMEIESMDIDPEPEEEQSAVVDDNDEKPKLDNAVADDVDKKASEELPKRMVDHMYYVLDTNILMENLSFVDDLSHLALGDSKGSMLFIPYVVIKELDRIKDRRSEDDASKRSAARKAIRYLNDKFDKSLRIQGQSALEDAEHLIEVDGGDDSVVNCCVQLSAQVPKLTLLTNDANLRLKAKTSSIAVASSSDLLSRYHKDFGGLQS